MSTNFPSSLDSYSTKVDNTDDVMAADINNVQDAIAALEAKVGVDSSVVTTSLDYKVNNFFTSGRKVYLYENTAPTGWNIVAVTDKVLAVKGGSAAYSVDGGNTAGDFSHVHTGPSHNHRWYYRLGQTVTDQSYNSEGSLITITQFLKTSGYGVWFNNSNSCLGADYYTSNDGTGNTGGSSTYRPAAAVGIIVQKT